MTEQSEKKKESKERKGQWWRKYTRGYLEEVEKPQKAATAKAEPAPGKHEPAKPRGVKFIDPFEQMDLIQKEMDKSFRDVFRFTFRFPEIPKVMKMAEGTFKRPRINIQQTRKDVLVSVELPGVKKDEVKIKLEGRNLIIDAQRSAEKKRAEEGFAEFRSDYRGYRHVIRLPADVDKKESKARYEAGVLQIVLPKKEPSEGPSDIEIE